MSAASGVFAVDLGGTRIKLGIVEGERLIAHSVIEAESQTGLVKRLPAIEKVLTGLFEEADLRREDIAGIGISIPGIVDSNDIRLLSVNQKYSDAVGFDFVGWARDKWGLPIALENDARSALIGEWQYGAGKGCDNLAMLTLGTGIGGAAITEGKILRGIHFQAGILPGHFTVNLHGIRCNCGNIGCVESEASSWRLPEQARMHPLFDTSPLSKLKAIDYKQVFELAGRGDALSGELIGHSIETWSACVVNLIHAYDPEMVILGGGIMRSGSHIIPAVSEIVRKRTWTPWGNVKIVPAEQADFAALFGVSYLVTNK